MGGFDTWKLLAGLGIFLFGMFLMEEAIKKLAGRSFKRLIREYTSSTMKSISSGMFVTAVLQSSSAVSLMILAFVGAGIMTMESAIGVILGSNIGTTITAWIVASLGFSLKIESFALPLIGIGGLGTIFLGNSERYSNLSKLLVGFGFLFMGLDYMKGSVEAFTENFDIASIPDYGLFVYLLLGLLLTAIMQSSSATIAIILTALNARIMDFDSAAAMIIGANVGTTVTILLGAIGAVRVKKRVAFSHFTFNMITGIIAIILLPVLTFVVTKIINPEVNPLLGIALFHTVFNLIGVLVFLPFIRLFARLLNKLFPDHKTALTRYINNTTSDISDAALAAIRQEAIHLVNKVLRYNLRILNIDEKLVFTDNVYNHSNRSNKQLSAEDLYLNLKLLQSEILTFASAAQAYELNKNESLELSRYLHAARMALHSAKSIKDIKHDFDEFESADNIFLNDQYTLFRRRLIETYLKIDKMLTGTKKVNITKAIIKLLKQLKENDQHFVQSTSKAINSNLLSDINVSTAILVNRAFVHSSRQILLSIRELLLSNEESDQYDEFQEIHDDIVGGEE
jgi:phosphate:Na+ symporter